MITYSQSFLDFLQNSDCKVANILFKCHHAAEGRGAQSYGLFVTNKLIDYITFRNDGTISYLPAGKEHKTNDSGEWAREGRQNGKPGKVIQKLFTANALKILHNKEFECFTNEYKAEYNGDNFTFALRPNKEIPSVYCMERAEGGGTLNDSCMNNDRSYLSIYKNCKQLQILTLTDRDGNLCGRALIWAVSEDLTIMDRIYITKDFMYNLFLDYARKQGWYHKKHYKTYSNKTEFVAPDGTEIDKKLSISTDTEFDEYPYIDTFSYGDYGSLNNYGGGCYTYDNTDGTRSGEDDEEDDHEGEVFDEINDEYISEDDAIYIEHGERRYRDRYCHQRNCVNANDGFWYHEDDATIAEVNGTYYRIDSGDIIEVNGDWYLSDDVVYSEFHEEDLLLEDCIYSNPMNDHILKSEAIEVDGEWYHKDHEDLVEIDGVTYHKDNLPPPRFRRRGRRNLPYWRPIKLKMELQ